jgi:hypothetical protein
MSRYNYLISTQELKTQVDDLRRMVHVLLAEKEEAERKAASKAESDQRLERAEARIQYFISSPSLSLQQATRAPTTSSSCGSQS